MAKPEVTIDALDVQPYVVPTEAPESDGTLRWDRTTLVLVEARGGGRHGLGWTYSDQAAATLIGGALREGVVGRDALAPQAANRALRERVRNLGDEGLAATAISAIDIALWDLKARLLDEPLIDLLGAARERAPIYGSGGFTSLDVAALQAQLAGWVGQGIPRVKMKVGREPRADPERVRAARRAVGDGVALYVDANGGYGRREALAMGERFAALGVSWYEEPVSSDDVAGLRWLRDRVPAALEVAAGEYGWAPRDFVRLIEPGGAGAVDVLQADVTRCGGITGLLLVGALCEAHRVPLSTHTAPSLHLHPACALAPLRHVEWFHDHVRIEQLFFEGAPHPQDGAIAPDRTRLGLGLALRRADAARYAL